MAPTGQPLSSDGAIQIARQYAGLRSTNGANADQLNTQAQTAPVVTELMPYTQFQALTGPGGPEGLINQARCIWVVTVDSPIAIHGAPGYTGPATEPAYSVGIDQGSGKTILVMAAAFLTPTGPSPTAATTPTTAAASPSTQP